MLMQAGPPKRGGDPEVATPDDVIVREGQFFVSVDDRTAFVGGGATVLPDGELERSSSVWRVDVGSSVVDRLDDLPTSGIVAGVSGAVVDDEMVVSAQICGQWVESAEFFQCFGDRSPVLWAAGADGGSWREIPIPDEMLEGGGFPGASGRDVRAVGVRGSEYLFVWFGLQFNRVFSFDAATGEVTVVVDLSSRTTDHSSYPPVCLADDATLLVLERQDEGVDVNAEASYVVSQVDADGARSGGHEFEVPPLTGSVWLLSCDTTDRYNVAVSGRASQLRVHDDGSETIHELGSASIGSHTGGPHVWLRSGDGDDRLIDPLSEADVVDHGPMPAPWGSEYIAAGQGLLVASPEDGLMAVDL